MPGFLFSLACVALVFGLGGVYLTKHPGAIAIGNLITAAALFIGAVIASTVSVRRRHVGLSRRALGMALLHAALAVIVMGGILLASSRLTPEWDFTKPRLYTLSDFSKQVLKGLSVDINAVYAGNPAVSGQERILIERFAKASKHFRLKIVTPDELGPKLARQIERGGSKLILFCGGRAIKVPTITERAIIQTVLDFSMRADTTLCFLTGHGERSLHGMGANGLSSLQGLLEHEGFQTTELMLATRPAVPEECDIVVVAAPEKKLLPAERDRLRSFVDHGGRLLVFAEPGQPLEPATTLSEKGLSALNTWVVDEASSLFGSKAKGTEPIVNRFDRYHPIVQGLSEKTGVIFSGARPLVLRGADPQGFVYTNRTSRFEMPGGGEKEGLGEEAAGMPLRMRKGLGPFPLGASVQWKTKSGKEARVVLFGDVDFATNRLIGALYNEDLVMGAVYYLAHREDRIRVRPKMEDLYQSPLIPERTFEAFHSLALLIPEAILILGLIAWYRRRRL